MAHFIIESALKVIDVFAIKRKKSLLLIRLDQIGDYILFRNYIQLVKEDVKYKNYEITLCGNIIWKELAENLDNKYLSRFIWIDKKKVNESKVYWWFLLLKIHLFKYEFLINPTYSRTEFEEEVVSHFRANEKIGNSGDNTNLSAQEKIKYDGTYTRLIKAKEIAIFEFYRNNEFWETLLGYKLKIKKPEINIDSVEFKKLSELKNKYILIVPFAGQPFRIWSSTNFKKTIDYILKNSSYDIILSGSKTDRPKSDALLPYTSPRIHNFSGETNLLELSILINNSELLITHDTSAVHIGAALNKDTICISNGNYYGRFVPYPKEITTKIHLILPEEINYNENINSLAQKFKSGSKLDINSITTETVTRKIEQIIQNKLISKI